MATILSAFVRVDMAHLARVVRAHFALGYPVISTNSLPRLFAPHDCLLISTRLPKTQSNWVLRVSCHGTRRVSRASGGGEAEVDGAVGVLKEVPSVEMPFRRIAVLDAMLWWVGSAGHLP